jgi:hypothetical protein
MLLKLKLRQRADAIGFVRVLVTLQPRSSLLLRHISEQFILDRKLPPTTAPSSMKNNLTTS